MSSHDLGVLQLPPAVFPPHPSLIPPLVSRWFCGVFISNVHTIAHYAWAAFSDNTLSAFVPLPAPGFSSAMVAWTKILGLSSIGAAAAFLGMVAFDVPFFKQVYFLRIDLGNGTAFANQTNPFGSLANQTNPFAPLANQTNPFMDLGVLGFCADLKDGRGLQCSTPTVGYKLTEVSQFIDGTLPSSIAAILNTVTSFLTKALVLHIVAFGIALLSFTFALLSFLGLPIAQCFASCFCGFAAAAALAVFIFDIVFFELIKSRIDAVGHQGRAVMGGAVYLTLFAWLLLFITPVLFFIGRIRIPRLPSCSPNNCIPAVLAGCRQRPWSTASSHAANLDSHLRRSGTAANLRSAIPHRMRIHGVLWALSLALVSLLSRVYSPNADRQAYDGDGDSPHDIEGSSTRSLTSPSPSSSIENPFHTPTDTSGFTTPIGTQSFPSSSTFVAATSFIGTAPSASSSASAAAVAAVTVRKGPIVAAAVGGSIASTHHTVAIVGSEQEGVVAVHHDDDEVAALGC
ncbi:hypothetical protein C8R47DRAFT_1289928 [Mycena vitilis]|nr:hypothetical protein C8R47DRAFT_1289928 [Mycena vitilis]